MQVGEGWSSLLRCLTTTHHDPPDLPRREVPLTDHLHDLARVIVQGRELLGGALTEPRRGLSNRRSGEVREAQKGDESPYSEESSHSQHSILVLTSEIALSPSTDFEQPPATEITQRDDFGPATEDFPEPSIARAIYRPSYFYRAICSSTPIRVDQLSAGRSRV
jgi:hypothetical protein